MNGFTYYKKKRLRKEELRYNLSKRENRRFNKIRLNRAENDHFDTVEVCKIEELSLINPKSALEKLEAYLEKYPNDYYAHTLYANYLVLLRRFDEAYEEIKYAEKAIFKDSQLKKHEEKYYCKINCLAYAKLKYYLYTDDYENAHDVIMNCIDSSGSTLTYKTVFYIKNKLNTCDKMNYFEESYSVKQILEYSEERMLNHIRKHLTEGNDDKIVPNSNVFVRDFPIYDVLQEAKKYLVDENAVYLGLVEDDYFFKYDACGKEKNKYVDYFKIVCFHGKSDIITVLPISKYNEVSYIDLTHMNSNSIDNCKQLVLR